MFNFGIQNDKHEVKSNALPVSFKRLKTPNSEFSNERQNQDLKNIYDKKSIELFKKIKNKEKLSKTQRNQQNSDSKRSSPNKNKKEKSPIVIRKYKLKKDNSIFGNESAPFSSRVINN